MALYSTTFQRTLFCVISSLLKYCALSCARVSCPESRTCAVPCSNIVSTAALVISLTVGTCVGIYFTVNPTALHGTQSYATGGLQPNAVSEFENFQVFWRTFVIFNLAVATLFSYALIFALVRVLGARCSARVPGYNFLLPARAALAPGLSCHLSLQFALLGAAQEQRGIPPCGPTTRWRSSTFLASYHATVSNVGCSW